MKLDFIKTIIAIAVSCLIVYGFHLLNTEDYTEVRIIGSLIFLIPTLTLAIGVRFDLPRTDALIKTISMIFFGLGIVCNIIFSLMSYKEPSYYIIVCGIFFLIYILITYSVSKAQQ